MAFYTRARRKKRGLKTMQARRKDSADRLVKTSGGGLMGGKDLAF